MRSAPLAHWGAGLLGLLAATAPAGAQQSATAVDRQLLGEREPSGGARFATVRDAAERATGLHLAVSLTERRIRLRDGSIVLHEAEIAVGKGGVLSHEAQTWDFATPVGERRVLAKEENPVWIPPDWHYVEIARERGLELVRLEVGNGIPLADGSRVEVRGERVARVWSAGHLEWVPPDEEMLFGDTILIPPFGTRNRRITGELGRYKLDIGDGYLIHGTPHEETIGTALTHGCIRLRGEDLRRLYEAVPVGTSVFIY